MLKFFISFDLENAQGKYNLFYEEAEKCNLFPYIPANYTENKSKIDLPNTTLFGVYTNAIDIKATKMKLCEVVDKIYKKVGVRGKYIVICSNGSYTKTV